MTPRFSIDVEPGRRVVRVKIDGFFQLADVTPFITRRYAAQAELRDCTSTGHLTLCDVSECRIQLQDVVEAFRPLLADPALMSERLAFVTGTSSVRMQIRRLINRNDARVFHTVDEAEAWLFAGPATATCTAPRRIAAPDV